MRGITAVYYLCYMETNKTQAQNIKVGQTIKYGNEWGVVIEAPVFSKSGKEVSVKVSTIASKVRRRDGFTSRVEGGIVTEYYYRPTTLVQTR